MKKGQIVTYYPGISDVAVADRNGANSFPAIITQLFEPPVNENTDADKVMNAPPLTANLCVFLWNGMSPVLGVQLAPEGMDMNEPHENSYFAADAESADLGDMGPQIMESIAKTQQQLETHAANYAEANKAIGEAMNQNVKELTELCNGLIERIAVLEKSQSITDQTFGELDKRIKGLEKKK